MGPRISSKKMVSNTQMRINDGSINAQMPRMPAHVLSRQKSCRGRRIGGHVRGGRGFIPFQYLTAQPGTNRVGHVRRIDAPPIGHWGRLPGGGQPGSGRCAGGTRWLFGLEQSIGSWRITGLQRDSVSAELLNQNVVATDFVAGCQEVGLAEAALQALNDEGMRLGESVPQDSAARQEGSLVRVSKS